MLDEDELQEIAEAMADEGLEADDGSLLAADQIVVVLAALQERGLDLSQLTENGRELTALEDELSG